MSCFLGKLFWNRCKIKVFGCSFSQNSQGTLYSSRLFLTSLVVLVDISNKNSRLESDISFSILVSCILCDFISELRAFNNIFESIDNYHSFLNILFNFWYLSIYFAYCFFNRHSCIPSDNFCTFFDQTFIFAKEVQNIVNILDSNFQEF